LRSELLMIAVMATIAVDKTQFSGGGQRSESLTDVADPEAGLLFANSDRLWPDATGLSAAPDRVSTASKDAGNDLVVDES
jgi:hypothetical protein